VGAAGARSGGTAQLATERSHMQIAQGIHRLTRGITNFYLLESQGGAYLVDAGTPRDWDLLTGALAELSIPLDALEGVLLTHAHADHTGFAERARVDTGATVWIHHADEHAVKTGETDEPDGAMTSYLLRPQLYKTMLSLGRRGASKVIPVLEVATFSDGELLDLPGKPRIIHAPGHTAGSSAILLEDESVLLAGDVLSTWNPLTGRAGPQIMPAAMNRDTRQALESLDNLDGVAADLVLPGHGEPWTHGVAEALRVARLAGRS
jgi:glyoxylase-like metal-dependent hydrolase (beta-lactamase superfamily II)